MPNGNPHHPGQDGGRQFVDCAAQGRGPEATRRLGERLWLERLA